MDDLAIKLKCKDSEDSIITEINNHIAEGITKEAQENYNKVAEAEYFKNFLISINSNKDNWH